MSISKDSKIDLKLLIGGIFKEDSGHYHFNYSNDCLLLLLILQKKWNGNTIRRSLTRNPAMRVIIHMPLLKGRLFVNYMGMAIFITKLFGILCGIL